MMSEISEKIQCQHCLFYIKNIQTRHDCDASESFYFLVSNIFSTILQIFQIFYVLSVVIQICVSCI